MEFLTNEGFFRGDDDGEPRQGGKARSLAGRESGRGKCGRCAGRQTLDRPSDGHVTLQRAGRLKDTERAKARDESIRV